MSCGRQAREHPRLGTSRRDTAGAFYDAKAKKLVVNVVNKAAAEPSREAGAEARVVEHTLAQLTQARTR